MRDFLSLSLPQVAGLAFLAGYVALTYKSLPFAYAIRLSPAIYRWLRPRLFRGREKSKPQNAKDETSALVADGVGRVRALFEPRVSYSRAILSDIDINMHKSNSTYLLDADVSRGDLVMRLFARAMVDVTAGQQPRPGPPANFILAGVQALFLREVAPFQAFAMVSRVLSWDAGAVHVVTYFVRPGWDLPALERELGEGRPTVVGPSAILAHDKARKGVFAIATSRYVVRAGREKIAPVDVFRAGGLFPPEDDAEAQAMIERARADGMEFLKKGLV